MIPSCMLMLQTTLGRLEQSLADTEGGLAAAQDEGRRVADHLADVERATFRAKNDLQARFSLRSAHHAAGQQRQQ